MDRQTSGNSVGNVIGIRHGYSMTQVRKAENLSSIFHTLQDSEIMFNVHFISFRMLREFFGPATILFTSLLFGWQLWDIYEVYRVPKLSGRSAGC